MNPAAVQPGSSSLRIDTIDIEMEFLLTAILPAPLHRLARSFLVQALVASATIALVSASSTVATVDPATVQTATPSSAFAAR